MQSRDGVFLEDLCPKLRERRWRQSLHLITEHCCLYCGDRSESIDHVQPISRGGESITENCVPACLGCNGRKGDHDAFSWYRRQNFYDPRRAMALRAWTDGDMRLATRLLQWTKPEAQAPEVDPTPPTQTSSPQGSGSQVLQPQARQPYQTRQAATPLWRWQMAS